MKDGVDSVFWVRNNFLSTEGFAACEASIKIQTRDENISSPGGLDHLFLLCSTNSATPKGVSNDFSPGCPGEGRQENIR